MNSNDNRRRTYGGNSSSGLRYALVNMHGRSTPSESCSIFDIKSEQIIARDISLISYEGGAIIPFSSSYDNSSICVIKNYPINRTENKYYSIGDSVPTASGNNSVIILDGEYKLYKNYIIALINDNYYSIYKQNNGTTSGSSSVSWNDIVFQLMDINTMKFSGNAISPIRLGTPSKNIYVVGGMGNVVFIQEGGNTGSTLYEVSLSNDSFEIEKNIYGGITSNKFTEKISTHYF